MSDHSHLTEIRIRNLGIIEDATLEIGKGFTVLTGETGAGKTMVLTALALVLGGKADSSLVRHGKDRLVASATFEVGAGVKESALELVGSVEDDQLILTRSMSRDGKSRASVGGIAVPANVLASLSEYLIEIHGQSASVSMTKQSKQREMLDRFGGEGLELALNNYSSEFECYVALQKKFASLKQNSAQSEKEIASLRIFQSAFEKVKPQSGEFDLLSQEISRMSSVEALKTSTGESAVLLDNEETGINIQLAKVVRNLESAAENDSSIAEILDSAKESLFQLRDATQFLHRYLEDLGADPARLESALSRRSDILQLIKNFGELINGSEVDVQVTQLNEKYKHASETISDLAGGEDRLTEMNGEIERQKQILLASARELSLCRESNAEKLADLVTREIQALAMPHALFHCLIKHADYDGDISMSALTSNGADDIAMTIQAHVDAPEIPLAKGASGGEMSRIMLAIEVVLASTQPLGTYIFDEVDAGVGGKAAIEVGRRLFELSRHAQVIVVTHLPQVAAWADSHFVIKKSNDGTVSQSDVFIVNSDERVEEIARMLAGHEDSRSAQEHAAELLLMRDGKSAP